MKLRLLHRDTLAFESTLAYDGGEDGLDVVRAIVRDAVLKPGGAIVLELGDGQPERLGLEGDVIRDEDGDVRGLVVTQR